MPFEERNALWKMRAKSGRKFKINSSTELEEDLKDYFEQTSARRDWDIDVFVGKDGRKEAIGKPVPFSKIGACLFLGITTDTWNNNKKRGDDFLAVLTWAEYVILNQNIEGSFTGHYNGNVVAKVMKLGENNAVENKSIPLEVSDDLKTMLLDEMLTDKNDYPDEEEENTDNVDDAEIIE